MADKSMMESMVMALSSLGEISVQKMNSDYCLYVNGILIGDICDGKLFLKKFPQNEQYLRECPQYSSVFDEKPMYQVNTENEEWLSQAVYSTFVGAVEEAEQKVKITGKRGEKHD